MKQSIKAVAVGLIGAGLVAFAAAPAMCSDEFCAMGGTQIKVEVVKDKALDWGKDQRKAVVVGEETDTWSVLALSKTDDDIAILVTPGSVFFGVAGKAGQEVDARDAEKAFGRDLKKLTEAVKKGIGELWKASVVKIQGADVQAITNVVGLGVIEKGREWELSTQKCTGLAVDASELK
jgi:hypothetical protein